MSFLSRLQRSLVLLTLSVVAVGLAFLPSQAAFGGQSPLCEGRGIKVDVGFARAGAHACTISRRDRTPLVRIDIRPETIPINPSPWYGFRLVSNRARPVMIELNYGSYQHRYHPHFADTLGVWTRIEPNKVVLTSDKRQALISLNLARGRTWVAGQPFDDADNITQYLDASAQMGRLSKATIGTSVGGRPLVSYLSRFEADPSLPSNDISNQQQVPKGTLVLLSRQHPPEISGEWAFDAFVAQVLSESEQAKAFRGRFQILILPVLNPDGIIKGHWRTNLGLIDLNRDWGPFTQPETKAAAQAILGATRMAPPIAMIDFHSTNRDVIYAQPSSTSIFPLNLVDDWLRDWTEELGSSAPPIDRSHNPLNASSKTWGRSALGIGAITYEVGDNTSRTVAEDRAALAARLFMAKALALPDNQLSDPRLTDGRQP